MLTYAYKHYGGQDNRPMEGVIPTDPKSGYSHIDVGAIQGFSKEDIAAVRFYCQTSAHNRTVSFYTSNNAVRDIAWGSGANTTMPWDWTNGWTPLSGHSANLPSDTDTTGSTVNFIDSPFAKFNTYRWTVYGNNKKQLPLSTSGYRYYAKAGLLDFSSSASKPVFGKPIGLLTPDVLVPTGAPSSVPGQAAGSKVVLKIDSSVPNLKLAEIVIKNGPIQQFEFPVEASSNEDQAALAVDGNEATSWRSNVRDPLPWIALDLTGVPFDTILVKPLGFTPKYWSPSELQISIRSDLESPDAYWAATFQKTNRTSTGFYAFHVFPYSSVAPTRSPTLRPTVSLPPNKPPTKFPTRQPSAAPTPSPKPTVKPPTMRPSSRKTAKPTLANPTGQPTSRPSHQWSMIYSYSYSSAEKPHRGRFTVRPTVQATAAPSQPLQPLPKRSYLVIDQRNKPGANLSVADISLYSRGARVPGPFTVSAKGCNASVVQQQAARMFDGDYTTYFSACDSDGWLSLDVTGVVFDRVVVLNRATPLVGYTVAPGGCGVDYSITNSFPSCGTQSACQAACDAQPNCKAWSYRRITPAYSCPQCELNSVAPANPDSSYWNRLCYRKASGPQVNTTGAASRSIVWATISLTDKPSPGGQTFWSDIFRGPPNPEPHDQCRTFNSQAAPPSFNFSLVDAFSKKYLRFDGFSSTYYYKMFAFTEVELFKGANKVPLYWPQQELLFDIGRQGDTNGLDCSVSRYWSVLKRAAPLPRYFPVTSEASLNPTYNYNVDQHGPGLLIDGSYSSYYDGNIQNQQPWMYMDITGLDFDSIKVSVQSSYSCLPVNSRVSINADPMGGDATKLWASFLGSAVGGSSPNSAMVQFQSLSADAACPTVYTLPLAGSMPSPTLSPTAAFTRFPTMRPSAAAFVRGKEYFRIEQTRQLPLHIAEVQLLYRGVRLTPAGYPVFASPAFLENSGSPTAALYKPSNAADGNLNTNYLSGQTSQDALAFLVVETTTRQYDTVVVVLSGDANVADIVGAQAYVTADIAGDQVLWSGVFGGSTASSDGRTYTFVLSGSFLSYPPTLTWSPTLRPTSATILPTVGPSVRGRRLLVEEGEEDEEEVEEVRSDRPRGADRLLFTLSSQPDEPDPSKQVPGSPYSSAGKQSVALFPGQDFTIQAWVYSQSYSKSPSQKAAIFAVGSLNKGSGILLRVSKVAGVELQINNQVIFGGGSQIRESTWQHVAVTRCGGVVRLFIDGNKVRGAKRWAMLEAVPRLGVVLGANPDILKERLYGYLSDVDMSLYCEFDDNFAIVSKRPAQIPTYSPTPAPPTRVPTPVLTAGPTPSPLVVVAKGVSVRLSSSVPITLAEIKLLYKQRVVPLPATAVQMQASAGHDSSMCLDNDLTTYCATEGVHEISLFPGQAAFDQVQIFQSSLAVYSLDLTLQQENAPNSGYFSSTVYGDTFVPREPFSQGTPYTPGSSYVFDLNCPVGSFSPTGTQPCFPCVNGLVNFNGSSLSCDSSANYCPMHSFMPVLGRSPGPWSGNSVASCLNCPPGTFTTRVGGPCLPVPAGFYASSVSNPQVLTCAAGTYSTGGALVCSNCPTGTTSKAGATSCTPTPPGTYYSVAQMKPLPCPLGSYASGYGVLVCTPCWAGTSTLVVGSTTCFPVPAGYFSSLVTAGFVEPFAKRIMVPCPKGTSSPPAASSCTPCAAGFYADTVASAVCKPSPTNMFPTVHLSTLFSAVPPPLATFSKIINYVLLRQNVTFAPPAGSPLSPLSGTYQLTASNYSVQANMYPAFAFDNNTVTELKFVARFNQSGTYTGTTTTTGLVAPRFSQPLPGSNLDGQLPAGWFYNNPIPLVANRLIGRLSLPQKYTLTFSFKLNAMTSYYGVDLFTVACASCAFADKTGYPRVHFSDSSYADRVISNFAGTSSTTQAGITGDFALVPTIPKRAWVTMKIQVDNTPAVLAQVITLTANKGSQSVMNLTTTATIQTFSANLAVFLYAGGVFSPTADLGSIKDITFTDDTVSAPLSSSVQGEWLQFRVPGGLVPTSYTFKFPPTLAVTRWSLLASKDETSWLPLGQGGGSPLYACAYDTIKGDLTTSPYYDASADFSYFRLVIEGARTTSRYSDKSAFAVQSIISGQLSIGSFNAVYTFGETKSTMQFDACRGYVRLGASPPGSTDASYAMYTDLLKISTKMACFNGVCDCVAGYVLSTAAGNVCVTGVKQQLSVPIIAPTLSPTQAPSATGATNAPTVNIFNLPSIDLSSGFWLQINMPLVKSDFTPVDLKLREFFVSGYPVVAASSGADSVGNCSAADGFASSPMTQCPTTSKIMLLLDQPVDNKGDSQPTIRFQELLLYSKGVRVSIPSSAAVVTSSSSDTFENAISSSSAAYNATADKDYFTTLSSYLLLDVTNIVFDHVVISNNDRNIFPWNLRVSLVDKNPYLVNQNKFDTTTKTYTSQFLNVPAASSYSLAFFCPAGSYSTTGVYPCTTCPSGSVAPSSGSTACAAIATGNTTASVPSVQWPKRSGAPGLIANLPETLTAPADRLFFATTTSASNTVAWGIDTSSTPSSGSALTDPFDGNTSTVLTLPASYFNITGLVVNNQDLTQLSPPYPNNKFTSVAGKTITTFTTAFGEWIQIRVPFAALLWGLSVDNSAVPFRATGGPTVPVSYLLLGRSPSSSASAVLWTNLSSVDCNPGASVFFSLNGTNFTEYRLVATRVAPARGVGAPSAAALVSVQFGEISLVLDAPAGIAQYTCPAGTYASYTGACALCPVGTFSLPGQTSCSPARPAVAAAQPLVDESLSADGLASLNTVLATRLVMRNYTGPLFRLRRDSDSATADFYANVRGDLGSVFGAGGIPLKDWGGLATLYVTCWYDQSAGGNHALQSNRTLQPLYSLTDMTVNFTGNAVLNTLKSVFSSRSMPGRASLAVPTTAPSVAPTPMFSPRPTATPSAPTVRPSLPTRTAFPTARATRSPTAPTAYPSSAPTFVPSRLDGSFSFVVGSHDVPDVVLIAPTLMPTGQPSGQPSRLPTGQPSRSPSRQPVSRPTSHPSAQPFSSPTRVPSRQPTRQPTGQPTRQPTRQPTGQPTTVPTNPTGQPSRQPSRQPTRQPTVRPSVPTRAPSYMPSGFPSGLPTGQPSGRPSVRGASPRRRLLAAVVDNQPKAASSRRRLDVSIAGVGIPGAVSNLFSTGNKSGDVSFGYAPSSATYVKRPSSGPLYLTIDSVQTLGSFNFTSALSLAEISIFNGTQELNITSSMVNVTLDQNPYYYRKPLSPGISGAALVDNNRSSVFSMFNVSVRILINSTQFDRVSVVNTVNDCSYTTLEKLVYPGSALSGTPNTYLPGARNAYSVNAVGVPITGSPATYGAGQYVVKATYDSSNMGMAYATGLPANIDWLSTDTTSALRAFDGSKLTYWTFAGSQSVSITLPDSIVPIGFTITSHPNPDRNPAFVTIRGNNDGSTGGVVIPCTTCSNIVWNPMTYGWGRSVKGFSSFNVSIPQMTGQLSYSTFNFDFSGASGPVTSIGDIKVYALVPTKQYRPAPACRTRIANARISLSKNADGSQPFWSERFDNKGALEYSFTPFTFKRYLRIQGIAGIKGNLKSNWFKYDTDPLAVGDIQLFYKGQLLQNITAPYTSSNGVDLISGSSSPSNLLDGNASTYWSTNTIDLPFVSIDVSGRVFDKIIVNNPAGQYNALGNFHISITDDPAGMFPYWNATFTPGFVRAYEFDGPFPLLEELPQRYETRWKSDVATLPSAVYVVYSADQRMSGSAPLVIPAQDSFKVEAIQVGKSAGVFTMEAWVRGVPWGVKAGIVRFMDSLAIPSTQLSLLIYNGIQLIRGRTSILGGQPSKDRPAGQIGPVGLWFNSSNVNYTSSDWIHIALVRYSGTLALYWNGTLLDSSTADSNRQITFTKGDIWLGSATDEKGNLVDFQGDISDFVYTKGIPYNTSGFTPPPPGWTSNRSFVNGPVTSSKLQGDSFFAQTFNPATDVLSSYVNSGEALVLTTPPKIDINSNTTAIGSNSNMTVYSFITASSELSSADVQVLGAIKSTPAVTAQAAPKVFLRIDQRSRPGVVSGISVTKITLIKNGVAVPYSASNVFSKQQQSCGSADPANLASGTGVFVVCNPTDPWLYVDVTGLAFDSVNITTRGDTVWQQYQCRSTDVFCTPDYVTTYKTAISMYKNVTGTYLGSSNTLTAAQCMASCDKIPGCTGIDFIDDGTTLKHCFWNNFPLSEVVYYRLSLNGAGNDFTSSNLATSIGTFPLSLNWRSTYPYYKSIDTSTLTFATVSLTNVTDGSYAFWQDTLTIKSGQTNTFSFKAPSTVNSVGDLFLTGCPAGLFSEAGECVPCPSNTFKDVGSLNCRGLGVDQFGAATSTQLFSIPPPYKLAVTAVAPGPYIVSPPSTLVVDYPSVAAPAAFSALKDVLLFNGNFETTGSFAGLYSSNCPTCFAGWKGTGNVMRLAIGTTYHCSNCGSCSGTLGNYLSVPCYLNTLPRQGNWTAGLSGKFASLSTAITLPGDVAALVVSLVGNYQTDGTTTLPYGALAGGLVVGVFLSDPAAPFVSGDLTTYGLWLGNATIVGAWKTYECGSDTDVSAFAGRAMTLRLVLLTDGTALVDAVGVSYTASPVTAQAVAAEVVEDIRVPFSNAGFDDLPVGGEHFKGASPLGGDFKNGDWVGSNALLVTMPERPTPGFWWDNPTAQCWSAPEIDLSQSCAYGLAPWQPYSQFKTEPNQYSYFVALQNVGATLDKLFTFHPQVTTVSLSFVSNYNPTMGSWAIPNQGGGVVGIYLHNFETDTDIFLGQRTITGAGSSSVWAKRRLLEEGEEEEEAEAEVVVNEAEAEEEAQRRELGAAIPVRAPTLPPTGPSTSGWSTYSFSFDATQFRGFTSSLRLRFDSGCSNYNNFGNYVGYCYLALDNVQVTYRTTWSWTRPAPAPSPNVLLGGTYNFTMSSALNFASNVAYAVDDNFQTSAAFAVDTYQSQAPFAFRGGSKGVTTVKYALHCLRGPIKDSANACAVRPFPVSGEWIQMVVPTRVHPTAVSINTPSTQRVLEFVVLGSGDGVNWVLMSKRGDVSRTASMPLKWDAYGYDKWFAPKYLRVVVTAAQIPAGQGLLISEFSIFGYPAIVSRTGADGAFKCASGRILQQSDWSCVPCPLGTIYTALNVTCTPCPAGTFSGGAVGSTSCTLCPLGTSSPAGSAKCAMCPPGQYSNYPGGPCVSIPAGFFPPYAVKLPSVSLLSVPLDSRQTSAATSVNTGGIFPGRGVYQVTVSQPPSGRTYSVAERQAALSMLDLNPSTAFRLSTTGLYNQPGAYVGSTATSYQTPQGLPATIAGEYVEVRLPSRIVLNELSLAVVDSYSSRYVVEWILLGALSTAGSSWTEVEHFSSAAAANETWNSNSQYVRPGFFDSYRLVIVRINDLAIRYVGPDGVSRPPNPAMTDVLIAELSFVGDLELESVLSPWKWNTQVLEPLQCPSGFTSVAGSTQCSLFVPRYTTVLASVGRVQNVTVPTGMNMMLVKLWGAGGAGSSVDIGTPESATFGYGGGAGSYAQCYIPVTPGEIIQVIVGGGGYSSPYSDSESITYTQAGGFGGGGNATIKSNPFLSYGQVAAVGSGGGMTAIRRLIRPQTGADVEIWDYAAIAAGGGGAGIGNSTFPAPGGGGLASYATYNMKYSPAYPTSVDFEPIRKYVAGGAGGVPDAAVRWGGGAGGGAGYPGGRAGGSASKYTIGNGLGGVSYLGPESVGCIRTTALSFSGKSGAMPTSPTASTPAPNNADADYRPNVGSGGAFFTRPSTDRNDPSYARGGDGLAVLTFSGVVPKYAPRRLQSTSFSSSSISDAPIVELEAGMSYADHVAAAAAGSAQRRSLSSPRSSSEAEESEMTMHVKLTDGEPLSAEDERLLAAQASIPAVGSEQVEEIAAARAHTQRKLSRSSEPLDGSKWETPPSPQPVSRRPTARPSRRLDLPGRAPHAKYFSMYSGFSIVYSMADRRTNYPTRPLGDLKNVMKQAKLKPREQVASRFECDNVLYGPHSYEADSLHQVWVRMADTQTRWPTPSPAAPQRQKRVPTMLPTLRPTSGATSVPSTSVPSNHPTSGINGQFKPTGQPSAMPTSPTGQPSSEPTSTQFMAQFSFTGAAANFTVPVGVTSIWVDAYGAQGGSGTAQAGGKGAYIRALLSVTPGQVLSVTVGGPGGDAHYNPTNPYGTFTSDGGFNGGGSGSLYPQATDDDGISSLFGGGGGGGSSDVRPFGTDTKRRLVVAGGGGGALILNDQSMEFFGGPGGGAVGGAGGSGRQGVSPKAIAYGATQSVGGTNALVAPDGSCSAACGKVSGKPSRPILAGRFWIGGTYTDTKLNNHCSGGGGGGGYYGGGAGCLSGGGGGSSYTSGSLLQWGNGVRAGAGFVTITWTRVPTASPTPRPTIVPSPAPSAVPSAFPTNKYLLPPTPTRMTYPGSAVVVDYYTPPANTQAGNFYDLFIDDSGSFYGTFCGGDKRAFKLTLAGNTWTSTNIIAPATYECPAGITVLPNGDIYLGIQSNNPSVFKIPAGTSLPTPNSGSGFQSLVSGIVCPLSIVFDPTYSTMYVPDGCTSKIYTVDMATLAVTSTSALAPYIYSIATDAQGAIYTASPLSNGNPNNGVYKIANPKVSMVPVRLANINTPQSDLFIQGVCVDRVANVVYAVDNRYSNIYKIDPTTGDYVLLATWTGRSATECFVDKAGYVYIASTPDGYIGRLVRV